MEAITIFCNKLNLTRIEKIAGGKIHLCNIILHSLVCVYVYVMYMYVYHEAAITFFAFFDREREKAVLK